MAAEKTDIWVYAHWLGMAEPQFIGILSAHQAKGRKAFGFSFNPAWLQSHTPLLLDPDISWFAGPQFPNGKENFGVFLDSMPDRWGRTLMKRRAAQLAKEAGTNAPTLYEIDFLLGVQDESRMGGLRFKLDPEGPFLNNDTATPIPPHSSIRDLQYAANVVEHDADNEAVNKWLAILLAPGSSLGGARPKANIIDEHSHLWIAKFPSKNDSIDKGAWEFLVYQLAVQAGVTMSESKLLQVAGKHHTFLTKRFDRQVHGRIHFASAMTMTGNTESILRDQPASYLELAEFIQFSGATSKEDLHQLWRRIVFNIAVSNTDDHLRNHGFLLTSKGWRLSPAFDINPSIERDGLSLNITMEENALDFDLAQSVGAYFQLTIAEMQQILDQVKSAVKNWRQLAGTLKIPRQEQEIMEPAFRH
ncbi:MAG: HipA domain-containing protein [Saprospiraceae bacterium]|nr:HipA domain-containing protein [Lewinellaceae bacterium]